MSSGGDGGSRVTIPADLRKTIQTIREITGKQHSDEDIFAALNDCFNDPYETAQKLRYLDTFHEVRSKRDKKKENLVPNTQGNGRSGRRNFTSSHTNPDVGNGRRATFKGENGVNHIKGGSRPAYHPSPNKARNITVSRAIKTSNSPTGLPNGVAKDKTQDDFPSTVKNQYAGQQPQPLCKTNSGPVDGVETDNPKASSELVAASLSGSVVQNHTQDALDENSARISKSVVGIKPAELQSSSLNKQDPSLFVPPNCNGHTGQASTDESQSQLLLESDSGERPHVTFPVHIQAAKALENGLMFGSFDCNVTEETPSNDGSIEGDHPNTESSYGIGDNVVESSPTSDDIPEEAPSSQDLSTFTQDKDNDSSKSAHVAEVVVSPVKGSKGDDMGEEDLSNSGGNHHIPSVHNTQQNVFGLVPSFSAIGQPTNTGAVETQNAISKPPTLLYTDLAASQQAVHLFRQQYHPNFFPYGPYFPPFYVPPHHPHIHQFLSPNGFPQQSYLPPGAAVASAPGIKVPFPQFKLGNIAGNPPPPAAVPFPYGSSTVDFSHIPAATPINSIHKEDLSISQLKENVYTMGPLSENATAWMAGQSLSNLQVSPMYNNLALQGQPLAFPPMQAGHGGFAGIYQPTHPVLATAPTSDQTLQPSRTTPAMAETVGPSPIAYQQPQAAQPNWASNY
ncbi:PREDICTED: GBF-interacting protein 1-like [Tarenaya hassleriana]|uniref:GBF-interacting protein 1-like n=1 Tax=Tarenaya hassleriana TaxID=28532 RepID=UPI00053C2AE3|nr:PREDICTED: GBF-interacting protein 1-like [Tarenaya hassleriana]